MRALYLSFRIDFVKFQNNLGDHTFYIEPTDPTLKLPDDFDVQRFNVMVSGRFYEKEDYPEGMIEYEDLSKKQRFFATPN